MGAALSMGLAVLIWSLYPLAAAEGLKTMSGLELVLVSSAIAAITVTIFIPLYLLKKKKLSQFLTLQKQLDKRAYINIALSTITNVACHACFFTALTMAHKGGVSIVYEMWPIMALIATPFLMRKKWKVVSFGDFFVSLLSLVGIGIIVISTESIPLNFLGNTSDSFDYIALLGYVLAFIGAYSCALAVVFKAALSEYFEPLNDKMASSLIGELYPRILSTVLLAIGYVLFSSQFDTASINWEASFFVGFVVMFAGGALYTLSLLLTDRPTIHIVYYFVPVLAVIWLWLAGETTINAGLVIGASIIVFSNIYLALSARNAPVSQAL